MFKKAHVVKYMKTCTEINISFIPYEAQVNKFDLYFCHCTMHIQLMDDC